MAGVAKVGNAAGILLPSALIFLKQKLHCECGFHLESAATCSCHEEKPCQLCASLCFHTTSERLLEPQNL